MRRPCRSLFVGVLLFFTGVPNAQVPVSATFQTNNVRAVVNFNGTLFHDFQQGQFVSVQPGLAEKTLLRGAGIWFTNIDQAGNLQGAVQLTNQTDFYPGPPVEDASIVSQNLSLLN